MVGAIEFDEATMIGDITFSEASLGRSSKRFREADASKQTYAFRRTKRPVKHENPLDTIPRQHKKLDTDKILRLERQRVAAMARETRPRWRRPRRMEWRNWRHI